MKQINILEYFEKITGEKTEYWKNDNDVTKLSSVEEKNNECNRKRKTVTRPLDYKQRMIQEVKNGKTKLQVAEDFNLSYNSVKKITRGIPSQRVVPTEIRREIIQEIKKGKTKKQASKKFGLSYYMTRKITEDIKSRYLSPIPAEFQEKIRERVKNGENAHQVSKELGLSYNKVKRITRDIPSAVQLNRIKLNKLRSEIRREVKNGKLKKQVAEEHGIPFHQVQKITKDIRTIRSLSVEIQRRIREEVKKGGNKRQVSRELKVSYDSVRKYTMDIPGCAKQNKLQADIISKIRDHVRKNKSKLNAAEKFGVSWPTVAKYTKDIDTRYCITKDAIKKIRKEVEGGKSVRAVAKDNNIGYGTVYNHVDDIIHSAKYMIVLRGKTLELFRKVMKDGFALISHGENKCFVTLKKYFPSICRVRYDHKTIIFLEGKSNAAAKAFLESINSRTMSYRKLSHILKLFDSTHNQRKKRHTR